MILSVPIIIRPDLRPLNRFERRLVSARLGLARLCSLALLGLGLLAAFMPAGTKKGLANGSKCGDEFGFKAAFNGSDDNCPCPCADCGWCTSASPAGPLTLCYAMVSITSWDMEGCQCWSPDLPLGNCMQPDRFIDQCIWGEGSGVGTYRLDKKRDLVGNCFFGFVEEEPSYVMAWGRVRNQPNACTTGVLPGAPLYDEIEHSHSFFINLTMDVDHILTMTVQAPLIGRRDPAPDNEWQQPVVVSETLTGQDGACVAFIVFEMNGPCGQQARAQVTMVYA